jgi:hypothetical protein
MPHIYTDTLPVKQLDPLLPLADFPNARNFTRHHNKQRVTGRVIPQRIDQDNTHHHHDTFYVEFPSESGNFYQISIKKLAGTIGDRSSSSHFITKTAAATLDLVPTSYDLTKLLKICTV